MILLIDNYDSFVYNLSHYLQELGCKVVVFRNDALSVDEVAALAPRAIVISPGPCDPQKAGISLELVKRFRSSIPILGVCLGHQCIGEAYGGRIVRAPTPVHGQSSAVIHNGAGIFRGIPSPFTAGRYHSLLVSRESFPNDLEITAHTEDGLIMAIRDPERLVVGVQFHPESILTQHGHQVLRNFLELASKTRERCAAGPSLG